MGERSAGVEGRELRVAGTVKILWRGGGGGSLLAFTQVKPQEGNLEGK